MRIYCKRTFIIIIITEILIEFITLTASVFLVSEGHSNIEVYEFSHMIVLSTVAAHCIVHVYWVMCNGSCVMGHVYCVMFYVVVVG